MNSALRPIALAIALAGGLAGNAFGERPANIADTTSTLQANRDVSRLIINTKGGPGASGAATCRGIDGTLNATPDIKVTGWYCPGTGRTHLVHRNLTSKIAMRVFTGNVPEEDIGQPLYMAGTMTVLFSAFGDLGDTTFPPSSRRLT